MRIIRAPEAFNRPETQHFSLHAVEEDDDGNGNQVNGLSLSVLHVAFLCFFVKRDSAV